MTPASFATLRAPILADRERMMRGAAALAPHVPLPAGLSAGLRSAMIDAAHAALVHAQPEDDPITVTRPRPDKWAAMTQRSAAALNLPVVAVVDPDGIPRLV